MADAIREITDWKTEYGFLLDELIKQAQTINYLVTRLLEIESEVKQVISIDKTTLQSLKFAIPHIKRIVEDYDGITAFLSTNVSKRIAELETSAEKKESSYLYQ